MTYSDCDCGSSSCLECGATVVGSPAFKMLYGAYAHSPAAGQFLQEIYHQPALPGSPDAIDEDDTLYREGVNYIDRVSGKPVTPYHYSIDRPNANWTAPPVVQDDWYESL